MILLEAFLDLDGFREPPTIRKLALKSLELFRRRRTFVGDISPKLGDLDSVDEEQWVHYWRKNPINAWIGGNRSDNARKLFALSGDLFTPTFTVDPESVEIVESMLREVVEYKLADYGERPRVKASTTRKRRTPDPSPVDPDLGTELLYFPDLKIACGHFLHGVTDRDRSVRLQYGHHRLDPARHFIAKATGNSMDGGKNPVRDGDLLLLELMDATHAGSITGETLVIEKQNDAGDNEYVLRKVVKKPDGGYILRAANPAYPDFEADDTMRTLARLKGIIDPDAISPQP